MITRSMRIAAILLALVLVYYRKTVRRALKVIGDIRTSARLIQNLPGPGKKDEHIIYGHIGGPLFIKNPGDVFTPEWIVEHSVERFCEVSRDYREAGLFRVYGLNSSLPLNAMAIIIPTSIHIVREILSHKSMQDFNKGMPYQISHPLIGDSILATSREEWAPQRVIVERGFTHDIVGVSVPKMVVTANELVDKWERQARASHNEAIQDVDEDMLRLTIDVIGRAAFGFDFNSTTSEEGPLYKPFQIIFHTLERRTQYIHEHLLRKVSYFERNRIFDEALGKLDSTVDEILRKRRAEPAEMKTKRDMDFLDMLLKAENVSDELLRDNIKTLIFAGHDTTGAALAWFFYLLAKHPETMHKVREEIFQKLGKNGDPTYDDLEKLGLLNACFLETLRLYPSAGFTRTPIHNVEIGGYVIPKYSEILLLPYILHRDERYWGPQANEFIPERFLNEGFEQQPPGVSKTARMDSLQSRIARISKDKAYLPFSLGPRNCVGRPLALAEMRVVAIKLLQKFTFKMTENPEFREIPVLTLTLNPKSIRLVPVLMEN